MGVSKSQDYTLSKHAIMRIKTRFNIPATKVQSWTQRFLSGASFFKTDQDENFQTFKKDDVLMVLNVEKLIVVTVYPYNPFNKTNGLSENVLNKLQPSLDLIVNNEQMDLRDDLDGMMLDLQLSFQAYQSHPRSNKLLEGYVQDLDNINQRLEKAKTIIGEISGLKRVSGKTDN